MSMAFELLLIWYGSYSKYYNNATYIFLGEAQYYKIIDIDIEIDFEILRLK